MRIKWTLKELFSLAGVGYTIPAALVGAYTIIWLLYALEREGLRLLFYALLAYSCLVAIRAINRAVRNHYAQDGAHPSAYHVSMFWHVVSLFLLTLALVAAGLNNLVPAVPMIPESLIVAQTAASTVALSITNFILDRGGRTGTIRTPADPGPLRIFKAWRK